LNIIYNNELEVYKNARELFCKDAAEELKAAGGESEGMGFEAGMGEDKDRPGLEGPQGENEDSETENESCYHPCRYHLRRLLGSSHSRELEIRVNLRKAVLEDEKAVRQLDCKVDMRRGDLSTGGTSLIFNLSRICFISPLLTILSTQCL